MMIKDSGNRREYETGAVRDNAEGKGRCDWLRGDDDERHDRAFVWNIIRLIWTHEHITTNPEMPERSVFRDMTIRCVETDCYYNNDCICTAPPIFAVNGTAGKECFNYRED